MVYALGTRGAAVLVERGHVEEARSSMRKNRELTARYAAHQGMVANFRIALSLAMRERPDVRLLFFQPEGLSLRDRVMATHHGRPGTFPINPDGFFGLQFPDLPDGRNRAFFFLEADRSTMTRERFMAKLLSYWEWYCQGGHSRKHGIRAFRVLTVTQSEARLASLLRRTVEHEGLHAGSPLFWFTSEMRFTPERPVSAFEAIWEAPDQRGERQSIVPGSP